MSADSERRNPPNTPEAFESFCLDLFKEVWGPGSGAQKNGRSGQPQAGVDVYGRGPNGWIGVQCKQKDSRLGSQSTVQELDAEVAKARLFQPTLAAFVLATSGPRDAKLQQRARELTEKHRAAGLFSVEVWGWDDLWAELYGRGELFRRLLPIYWPRESALRPEPGPASGALALWHEKLGVLLEAEAIAIDVAEKFRLKKQIDEARQKIRELGGGG